MMLAVSLYALRRAVRTRLDEMGLNDALFLATDKESGELERIIDSHLPEAVRFVHAGAAPALMDGIPLPGAPVLREDLSGTMPLPGDFMRLISFRMDDWARSVSELLLETDGEYLRQADPFACGTWEKPVCALVRASGGNLLEFYACRTPAARLLHALYLPLPAWENLQGIPHLQICDKLLDAVACQAAGLTLLDRKDAHADSLFNLAKTYMQ